AKNPLPADKSRWGRYDEMAERNREKLRVILEAAAKPDPTRSPVEKQVGDYYAACMDETLADKKGVTPLKPYLRQIDAIKNERDLITTIAAFHVDGITALFNFYSQPDLKNANQVIANVDQGGISLPDRDYYLKTDEKNVERRAKYLEHVQKMFELAGEKPERAAADARSEERRVGEGGGTGG